MKKIETRNNWIVGIFATILMVTVLFLTARGFLGNPTSLTINSEQWKDEGPLELSPERGRFALMYSLVEDKSFQFSVPLAQFASPDIAIANGKFVSIFAPALSFIIMPGYMLGKSLGAAQVGSYLIISFFALLNVLLIWAISKKLGSYSLASLLSGLVFLFGSPAFAYGVSLYQHHVSTFLILSCIYVLQRWKNAFSLLYIWFICAFSVVLDNPNFFFMMPIGIYALTRLVLFENLKRKYVIKIKLRAVLTLFIMALPLASFMYINYKSYGNPFQLAGTAANADSILSKQLNPEADLSNEPIVDKVDDENDEKKTALGFFKTRNLPNGLYIHLFSPDRGTLVYAPLMFLGLWGLLSLEEKKHGELKKLILAVVLMVLTVYSLWGDPYGGWAFGSRYMIPAYALLSIGLSVFLSRWRHNILMMSFCLFLALYSVYVNSIGALTTNRIPPKVQVLHLEEISGIPQPYTYQRGIDMLENNRSKSFVFQTWASAEMTAWQYAWVVMGIIGVSMSGLFLILFVKENHFFDSIKKAILKK